MVEFMIKVLAWAFCGAIFVGLIVFIICIVGPMFKLRERIKVYYDDNDHSKGHYYVSKPGDTYPVGYPKKEIIKGMEEYKRLKREQKAKRRTVKSEETVSTLKKPRPMWLEILFMTPAEYMQYKRRRKEADKR